ncbi:acetyl esterase [Antricoccus suffuscus]|uniref:Acetyl esterase n=1 Tax=Antricoccus suffuscus TaxID=1629062 RepID=A0A2T0ZKC2_9ACTN|nr:alpha/beta hydrolase [Antricoccus suffuscus]PRZ36588.1 acetyl esterase [Antricoccus suffuscus]
MTLDQASQGFIAAMAEAGAPPMHEVTPSIARINGPVLAGMSGRGPEVGEVHNTRLTGKDGGTFRVRVLKPEGAATSVIVYIHGGGWVIGDIDLQYDNLGRELVNATQSVVVLVNYRKAPEHPFPTAIDDSYIGLQWAAEHAAEFAGSDVPFIVAGDSAGGNIAAVMTQWARDKGGPKIDYQVLVYPVTDCDLETASYLDPDNQLLLSRETMIWFWDHYLPDKEARKSPDASPLRNPNLAGLPPALVYLAECDPLHDEGAAYAEALKSAGVPVEVSTAEGQMHAFFQMVNILPGNRVGIDYVADRINSRIADLKGAAVK